MNTGNRRRNLDAFAAADGRNMRLPEFLFFALMVCFISGVMAPQEAQASAKQNPRLMIITLEYVDGIEQPAGITQAMAEEKFIARGFSLTDKSRMELVKEKDAALSFADPALAAALGRNCGAEIVVVIEARSCLVDANRPYGANVFAYECNAAGKAVKVDTAEVAASRLSSVVEKGGGRIPTANKSLKTAVSALADMLISDIE